MTEQTSEQLQSDHPQSALHRKARAGRVEHQTRAMSVPKALRLTLAKVADEMFDMAMAAIGVRMEKRGGEALGDLFAESALLMSLDGPSGRRGAAVFDAILVGGLIQQQTMGKVMPDTGDATRLLTATDAAICAPFLDALLERAALLPETESEQHVLQGYRFGTRAADARVLQMTLEMPHYQIVHITVDIAGGTRQGQITLCLPVVPKASDPSQRRGDDAMAADGTGPPRQTSLNETVMALHVDLNVALSRVSMPLSAISALAPGDVLKLGVTAFDQSRVLTMAGCGVGRGTLGQIDGVRALRVDHHTIGVKTPKRRASDRAELDLPEVSGDGTGTRTEGRATVAPTDEGLSELPIDDAMEVLPELAEIPDMSDLPGLSDDSEYPELSRAEAG